MLRYGPLQAIMVKYFLVLWRQKMDEVKIIVAYFRVKSITNGICKNFFDINENDCNTNQIDFNKNKTGTIIGLNQKGSY